LALFEAAGDAVFLAAGRWPLGVIAHRTGDDAAAQAVAERGLALAREVESRYVMGFPLLLLAQIARARGDAAAAGGLAEESVACFREADSPGGLALALRTLAVLARAAGDDAGAAAHDRESLRLSHELGERREVAVALAGIASVAADRDDWRRALRLAGAAGAAWEAIGPAPPAAWPGPAGDGPAPPGRTRDRVCRVVGEPAAAPVWAEGRALPLDEAVEDALAWLAPPRLPREPRPPAPEGQTATTPLTRREHEVAVLVAGGLTNRQIAQELVISERTAGTHVERIMNKLGVHARTQIAAWATERRLSTRPG
jgi:DNA-binding CsgD family transcriptional regulator